MTTAIHTVLFGLSLLLAAAASPAETRQAHSKMAHAVVAGGDAKAQECKEALLLAQSLPDLKGPDPLTRLGLARGMHSTVAMGPPASESDGGAPVTADDFERLQLPDRAVAYWFKFAEAGKRIAVTVSLRSDNEKLYSLYLLDASMSLVEFRELAGTKQLRDRVHPLIADQWPPLLFQLPATGTTWLLDMRPQEHHQQTWDVYARPVSRHVCKISVRFSASVAPAEVQY